MNILIYKKENCPHCDTALRIAQEVIQETAHTLTVKKVEDDGVREELLSLVPNAKTVPQVFVNGSHIGGASDFIQWMQEANESNISK